MTHTARPSPVATKSSFLRLRQSDHTITRQQNEIPAVTESFFLLFHFCHFFSHFLYLNINNSNHLPSQSFLSSPYDFILFTVFLVSYVLLCFPSPKCCNVYGTWSNLVQISKWNMTSNTSSLNFHSEWVTMKALST
jgi:hypothetical protein